MRAGRGGGGKRKEECDKRKREEVEKKSGPKSFFSLHSSAAAAASRLESERGRQSPRVLALSFTAFGLTFAAEHETDSRLSLRVSAGRTKAFITSKKERENLGFISTVFSSTSTSTSTATTPLPPQEKN